MPKFAANLSMLYPDVGFLDRFEAAASDGFKGVEYLFPYAHDASDLAARLDASGLTQVLFNAAPGDWDSGERGLACVPDRDRDFRAGVENALRYAEVLSCRRIHVMAGLVPSEITRDDLYSTYVRRLKWAAAEAGKVGVDVLIEPINMRDIPGYFLNQQDQAHLVLADVGAANLKVQMDLYHCQIVEGDLAVKVRKYVPTGRVGHVQIAGVPERHEPDVGEVNYPYLFDVLDACGYEGWVGCEYRPRLGARAGGTSEGLGWLRGRLTAR